MPLKAGDVVERYVVESLLGSGGMGEVYRARDTRLQRSVALKILRDVSAPGSAAGSNQSSGGAERLLREARAAAALEHANVIAVFDVGHVESAGSPNGMTYLAMELIKGASLRAYVGDTTVPIAERLRWLTDIARALGAAHRAGLVHRDIKPENVMIREDGAVKVLDFGIARRTFEGVPDPTSSTAGQSLATMTAQGVVIGTPQYMAPEQLRAEQLDGRADQFAWAVVAYELLTGKPPWQIEAGGIALVAQILSHEPPSLGTLADVPDHVTRAVTRALRKDKAARFPSMDVLIEALAGNVDAFAATMSFPQAPRSGPHSAPFGAGRRVPSSSDAFVSAPTEAVMTPSPDRRQATVRSERPPASATRSRAWVLAGAVALVAAAGGALALRGRGATGKSANGASAGANAKPPGCTTNKACMDAHGGQPWICRAQDHECAELASPDCTVLSEPGDVELDSTVWLGTLFPQSGEAKDVPNTQATDLARRDFAETLGKTGSARHIALVSCDTSADYRRAAHHLADDIGVPGAIVGTTRASDIIEIVSKIFQPKGVLAMVPLSASPLVTALPPGPSGRLVYRSTYSSEYLLAPTTAFVELVLEPQLSPPPPPKVPLQQSKRLRLAFLHDKALAASAFYDRLLTTLRFNGKSVIDNGDDFRDVVYDDDEHSYENARTELASFKPSLVLAQATPRAVHAVIEPLEKAWPAASPTPAVPRPTYVFSRPLLPELLDFVADDASRRRRFFGMDSVSTTAANAQFVNHYNQTFNAHMSRAESPGTSFDGFYAMAYAVEALGDGPVSGPAIAGAFRRLAGPGKTFLVGPQPIFDAYRELLSGASIDLEGTSGHLDLDPATGESTVAIAILCAAPRQGGAPARAVESGLVYEEKQHGFVGSLACP